MSIFQLTYKSFCFSLVCLFLMAFTSSLLGQDNSSQSKEPLESTEIEDLADLAKYDKTVKRLKAKRNGSEDGDKSTKTQEEDEYDTPNPEMSFSAGPIVTGLLYLLIIGLVVFILFILFSSIKIDKKVKEVDIPTKEEIEDIEVIDAESGLELALKAENYREAVRMLFIKLLQVLVQEKSIEWKPEKTNRDYLKEMKNHPKVQHFNNLVIAYERIWYGSEPLDKLFFDYLRVDFDKFYSTENVNIDA